MKIEIESTSKKVYVNGVKARVWEGATEAGVPIICFITRVAVSKDQDESVQALFRKELQETKAPSAEVQAFPLRMVL